jgi:pimeloyl-ACP methyl ester carboxylesterase
MLHGFPQHWYTWQKIAQLTGAGYRLICPDLRGFGWSQQPRRGYDIESLAGDMLALLDVLALDQVGLVGHDWGVHVGFRLCLRAPDRFTKYLALNMPHPWPRQRALLPNLWRQWYTAFVEYPVIGRALLRHWPAFTRFLLRHQVADAAVWEPDLTAEYAAATQASAHAGQSMFWSFVVREIPTLLSGRWRNHRLTVPTLILGGERDNVIRPSMLAAGEGHADDLKVQIVPGVGHFLPQEYPQAVAEVMREIFSART